METFTETAALKIDGLIAQSQSPESNLPPTFELNRPFFTPVFSVTWPPLGEIKVKHRLRRPTPNEEAEYKRKSLIQERVLANGKIVDERAELNSARAWLWDQIAVAISGYPGLTADSDGWVELTPQLKEQMRTAHKEIAIRALFDCEVTVLHEESTASFTGGEWAVRLRLGQPGVFYASMKLRFKEWDERQKHAFEKSASAGGSEIQGKTRLVTSAVNQTAFRNLFKATLIDVAADPEALHDQILADGLPFSLTNRDRFADAMLGEWQVDIITELAQIWRGK